MTQATMKRKKNRTRKIGPFIAGAVGLTIFAFFMMNSVKELMTTFKLNQELKVVETEFETLTTRQNELTLEKTKLEDPTYVQNYARGTHLLSKSEEQVFILPKNKAKE
ncbi:septum formation initiator family protein [Erysipelothrix urinaevulpis]|uniref:septum formation initiator family protein n=1 Tax=Erysipelothrix urinaevulpis TaxID=2683717 RepID=UPI00135A3917|nr:septum formation initiator family protein [Erysipelothrix urinaevulpis]